MGRRHEKSLSTWNKLKKKKIPNSQKNQSDIRQNPCLFPQDSPKTAGSSRSYDVLSAGISQTASIPDDSLVDGNPEKRS